MAYAAASDVGSLTRNLLGNLTDYSTTSCPTLAQVTAWLSSGCSVINSNVAALGFTPPIPTSSQAYELAVQVNALFAAWMAERSRTGAIVAANERTRADMLYKDYKALMDVLLGLDLSDVGVSVTTAGVYSYAGGISKADKSIDESDSDRVLPRFERDQFANPESGWGTRSSAS